MDSFTNGFDIGYRGPIKGVRRFAPNLKLRVGSKTILWNKMMKEVKLGCFAGPYEYSPLKIYTITSWTGPQRQRIRYMTDLSFVIPQKWILHQLRDAIRVVHGKISRFLGGSQAVFENGSLLQNGQIRFYECIS